MKNHLSIPGQKRVLRRKVVRKGKDDADLRLIELLKLRVAQIHQSPLSIEVHLEVLRNLGEEERRLQHVEAWRTSNFFDRRERAALTLCEKITIEPAHSLPDNLIQKTLRYFTESAVINLTVAIIATNEWNMS